MIKSFQPVGHIAVLQAKDVDRVQDPFFIYERPKSSTSAPVFLKNDLLHLVHNLCLYFKYGIKIGNSFATQQGIF